MIPFRKLTETDFFPDEFGLEDGAHITVLTQRNPGEVNQATPVDYYDVYLIQNRVAVWMWSVRSFEEYINLLFHGDNQLYKGKPVRIAQVFYWPSLPEENRKKFLRRMRSHGFELKEGDVVVLNPRQTPGHS